MNFSCRVPVVIGESAAGEKDTGAEALRGGKKNTGAEALRGGKKNTGTEALRRGRRTPVRKITSAPGMRLFLVFVLFQRFLSGLIETAGGLLQRHRRFLQAGACRAQYLVLHGGHQPVQRL